MSHAFTTGQLDPAQHTDAGAQSVPWSEVVQLERGRLREQRRWLRIGETRICSVEFSHAVALRGALESPALVLSDPGLRIGGWVVRSDEVLSLGAGHPFDLYIPAATASAFVFGPAVEESLGRRRLESAELLHRSSDAARESLWSSILQDGDPAPSRHRFDETLRRSLSASVTESVPAAPAVVADGTRGRAVRRALAFIEDHAHATLRLADLCAATGVGARTIEYGFREFYDVSPMTYVKYLRLNRARSDLVRAGPAALSVKRYAEGWGFRHMGQFAKDYKILFGENPSATLVRHQDRQ